MLLVTIPCCHLQIVCHNFFWFFQNSISLWLLKMSFVFGVKGALFVSLVSRPHVLSPVQSLYPGLDICSVSCLIVAVVLTEEQTKNGFDVLMNTSAVTLCKHSFWTYQFQSRLLWTPGKVVRLPLCNEKPSNRDKFHALVFSHNCTKIKLLALLLLMRKIQLISFIKRTQSTF